MHMYIFVNILYTHTKMYPSGISHRRVMQPILVDWKMKACLWFFDYIIVFNFVIWKAEVRDRINFESHCRYDMC